MPERFYYCLLIKVGFELYDNKIQHALSDNAKKLKFNPDVTINQECLITTFQECYYESASFAEAKQKMRYAFKFKVKKILF